MIDKKLFIAYNSVHQAAKKENNGDPVHYK